MTINQISLHQSDRIFAPLDLISISGEIQESHGIRKNLFNGNMSVVVYDQPASKSTLANGGLPPFTYQVRENILFSGNIPVKNGAYNYSFVVPRDISFQDGAGLIRYYFDNGTEDGNGSLANIYFNGRETRVLTDKSGPEIRLWLENENFTEGGSVSPNPLLIASLNDESGINTSGFGIGHELVLELDGASASSVLLNDYFRSDPGSWKSGTVNYQLTGLAEGKHMLKLKAWDIANNSSTATLNFMVDNALKIDEVTVFPNPFSDRINFNVKHNRYDSQLDVLLEILDMNGRILYTTRKGVVSDGYVAGNLFCEPGLASEGIYCYRISITDQEGFRHTSSGTLICRR